MAQPAPSLDILPGPYSVVVQCRIAQGTVGGLFFAPALDAKDWRLVRFLGPGASGTWLAIDRTTPTGFLKLEAAPVPTTEDLVWIPPGRFMMGSAEDEAGRSPDEGSQPEVEIPFGFWMGRCEITAEAYTARMGLPAPNPNQTRLPAVQVSHADALAYCQRLNESHATRLPPGYVFRLPTEAEWEYAARAGTTTRFSFGDDFGYEEITQYGWWRNNSNGRQEVGLKLPNPWGLHDMHGNVFEWCMDLYGPYPGGVVSPPGLADEPPHPIYRGGSNYCPAYYLRSASRHHDTQPRSSIVGFRIVLGADRTGGQSR